MESTEADIRALQVEVKSLRELVTAYRMADREAVQLALSSSKEAVIKAEQANEKRLDLLNEYRQQSADRDANFMRSDVYAQQHGALEGKVNNALERISSLEGRILALISLGVIVSTIVALVEVLRK